MENDKGFSNREGGRVIGGLILVGVGAALLLRNTGFMLPGWLFSWPMILILVGIYSGFKHNFRNSSWAIIVAIGGFFLVSRVVPELGMEPLFWPIVIIGLGVLFIVRPRASRWGNFKKDIDYHKWTSGPGGLPGPSATDAPTDDNDYLMVRSFFSGVKRNIISKNFQGGNMSCIFGGVEIDLTQAEIKSPVVIKLELIFGGAKLVVPAHWSVQNEIEGVFHGVDDKRKFNPDASLNPEKVLILKGSAVFGGVEIRSY
ncbi:MAG: DUF5668 domain-containing protein [Ferruginibacter sp.]